MDFSARRPGQSFLSYSRRQRVDRIGSEGLQNQERTAHRIAEFIDKILEPLGVAVLIDGKHMCAMARGVRDTHSNMKVNVMHGSFQKDQNVRNEFLMRVGVA